MQHTFFLGIPHGAPVLDFPNPMLLLFFSGGKL